MNNRILGWSTILSGGSDALLTLGFLHTCDNAFVRHLIDKRPLSELVNEVYLDFHARHVQLIWMSNVFRNFLETWGIQGISLNVLRNMIGNEGAMNTIFRSLKDFSPGQAYLNRIWATDHQATKFDWVVGEASQNFRAARVLLGFAPTKEEKGA